MLLMRHIRFDLLVARRTDGDIMKYMKYRCLLVPYGYPRPSAVGRKTNSPLASGKVRCPFCSNRACRGMGFVFNTSRLMRNDIPVT
jgi:hypothetical protein